MEEEGHITPSTYYTTDNSSIGGRLSVQDRRDLNLTNQITKATFCVDYSVVRFSTDHASQQYANFYIGMHFLSSG